MADRKSYLPRKVAEPDIKQRIAEKGATKAVNNIATLVSF